jgi:hypothetical protein
VTAALDYLSAAKECSRCSVCSSADDFLLLPRSIPWSHTGYPDEMRSLVAGALRFVGAPLFRALTDTPRRQLNLARWTRGREFRHLHGVSVTWLDSHFEPIERRAPWLHRVGSDVWDFCKGGVQPFFRLSGGFSAGASCIREVTAVYGFDGPLTPRLRSLDQAMPPAGGKWEQGHCRRRGRT